jgi:hypothetical protein
MEAVVGQVFLTVLVARLVGMHISRMPDAAGGDGGARTRDDLRAAALPTDRGDALPSEGPIAPAR